MMAGFSSWTGVPTRWLPVAALLLLPAGALATDGRIEINQSTVLAAGGFPFPIRNPGSYVLTGNLDPTPAGATGILILAHDVSLDLNGFAIRGSHVCDQSSCLFGAGRGIEAGTAQSGGTASRTRLSGGSVRGFGLECVKLGPDASVERVVVSSCGDSGIAVEARGQVLQSHVSFCGVSGIRAPSNSRAYYADNVIALADLGFGPGASVSGGFTGGANLCDGARCPGERRRFYLTTATFAGNHQTNVCVAGFHMASLWEIHEPTQLEYDEGLGFTQPDSGSGPPAFEPGWVRTGYLDTASGTPGRSTCSGWISTNAAGSTVYLEQQWEDPTILVISPWVGEVKNCSTPQRAWCVEE